MTFNILNQPWRETWKLKKEFENKTTLQWFPFWRASWALPPSWARCSGGGRRRTLGRWDRGAPTGSRSYKQCSQTSHPDKIDKLNLYFYYIPYCIDGKRVQWLVYLILIFDSYILFCGNSKSLFSPLDYYFNVNKQVIFMDPWYHGHGQWYTIHFSPYLIFRLNYSVVTLTCKFRG